MSNWLAKDSPCPHGSCAINMGVITVVALVPSPITLISGPVVVVAAGGVVENQLDPGHRNALIHDYLIFMNAYRSGFHGSFGHSVIHGLSIIQHMAIRWLWLLCTLYELE